ncbi:MAG: hypothetical protein OEW04_01815 [Nitrospirota bacterium]|nr:hypothetical protein [Nitrospirota bacterium]
MRIEDLRSEKNGNRNRVAATVKWEDSERSAQEVFFETTEPFVKDLSCNPDAFLIGCIMPAMFHGEKRVFLDAEVHPEIREGAVSAMCWIRQWNPSSGFQLPALETGTKFKRPATTRPRRAGMFFSGGIDSLATLRYNLLNFPEGHAWSIKDALFVYGLEIDDQEKFGYVVDSLAELTADAGITLVPVYTNIRQLEDDWNFWGLAFHDAVFAAIAHAFVERLNVVSISATWDIPNQQPYGTHPLLDMAFSSSDMLIRHDGILLSRLDKTRLVVEWDRALRNLRVCNQSEFYRPDMLNCGKCIKCVRAMVSLLALGVLDRTDAFPAHDVSVELLESSIKIFRPTVCFYEELIVPLRRIGRFDLACVIEHKISEYRRRKLKADFRAVAKRFDHEYFNGIVSSLRK